MGVPGVRTGFGRIGIVIAVAVGLSACGGYFSDEIGGKGFFAGGPLGGGGQAVDMGIAALARGDFNLAERYFKGVLRKDPKNPYALYGMGVIYHTMGQPQQARQMYESALAQQPSPEVRMIPWNGTVARPLKDVIANNLSVLDSGGVLSGGLGPMPSGLKANGGPAPVAGAASGSAFLGRGGAAALPARGVGGDTMLAGGDPNLVSRFKTLQALKDQGLITPDEFNARRQANLGALLPLTAPPPASGLERPVPTTEQIVSRLKALGRSLETRNITLEQHSVERAMILDALVPAAPVSIATPPGPPKTMNQATEAAHRLDFLRKSDLMTQEEYERERGALESAAAPLKAAAQPPPRPAAAAKAAPPPKEKKAAPKGKAKPAASGPQHGIHIASYKSKAAAEKGWSEAKRAAGGLLDKLSPDIRQVDLGDKGTFFRLKAGPLAGKAEVQALCAKLKAKGQFCEPGFVNVD